MKQELANYMNAETEKLKAKQRGDLWSRNDIQFPRLLAELEAAGAFTQPVMLELVGSMDLTEKQIGELVDRAQFEWEQIKENTFFRLPAKIKYFRSTTVSLAKERGQNSGLLDANRNDCGLTDNPYGMDSEPELYQAWEEGYEETFSAKS